MNDDKQIASYKELCNNPQWMNDTARCVLIDSSESKFQKLYVMNLCTLFSSLRIIEFLHQL